MVRVRLLKHNGSQAVRLPQEFAFPEGVEEVTIFRDGVRRVVVPTSATWDEFFSASGIELPDREQPSLWQTKEV